MSSPLPLLLLANETVNLVEAIRYNDWFGFVCLIILVGLSVWSFTVVFAKFMGVKRAVDQSRHFQRVVETDGSWEALFLAAKKFPESPTARLLKETYVECRLENWFGPKSGLSVEGRISLAKSTIENILMKTMSAEEARLLKHVSVLSMVTTLAPFFGLIGTVWGVLASFQALGKMGGASIAALAPGISTALVTTVFGLFAAIPALIAHHYFVTQVTNLSNQMETFSHELENAVRKQILNNAGGDK